MDMDVETSPASSKLDYYNNLDYESENFEENCSELINDIQLGKKSVLSLIEELGPLLVDTSPSKRTLGTLILTVVLENLPNDFLNEREVEFIITFYTDRLKDHHQVIPAVLRGIIAVSNFKHYPATSGASAKILTTLFHNVACQQQQQADRKNIYLIFKRLLWLSREEILGMGTDYVYGIISSIDGERDPRNLLNLFEWVPELLKQVPLKHLKEEFFEVLACYFPVDFRNPTQSENAITRYALADALCPCLTAVPDFAEFCLPLALEKLDSSLRIAKIDSFRLIERGCLTFEVSDYLKNSEVLWPQFQKILMNCSDEELEVAALMALSAFVKKISPVDEIIFRQMLKNICDSLKANLLPNSKYFEPSCKILLQVISASEAAATIVSREIVPILTNGYKLSSKPDDKVRILRELTKIHCKINDECSKEIPFICFKAASDENSEVKTCAYRCLSDIIDLLPGDIIVSLCSSLPSLLLTQPSGKLRLSIVGCFQALSCHYPDETVEIIKNLSLSATKSALVLYYESLISVASRKPYCDLIIDLFLTNLCIDETSSSDVSGIKEIDFLRRLVDKEKCNDYVRDVFMKKNVLHVIINQLIQVSGIVKEEALLNDALFLIETLIDFYPPDQQRQVYAEEMEIVSSTELSKTVYVTLLYGLNSKLNPDVSPDYLILDRLLEIVLREEIATSYVMEKTVQLLANLLNKCRDDEILEKYLDVMHTSDQSEAGLGNILVLLPWITKALVQRNHPRSNTWIDKMIAALQISPEVPKYFLIIGDSYNCLSSSSHYCTASLLYQQKFFTYVSKELSRRYDETNDSSYLLALGYSLQNAPVHAISLNFPKIVKYILLLLEQCRDAQLLTIMLMLLNNMVRRDRSLFEDHLQDFLERFLLLARFEKMGIRILAIQCIMKFREFPMHKLIPMKQQVLDVLSECINDKKRMVRKEAVLAVTFWSLFGSQIRD